MDKGRSQILQKYFHITEYSLCAVLLISLAGGLVPLNLLEVLPLFLPDNHLAKKIKKIKHFFSRQPPFKKIITKKGKKTSSSDKHLALLGLVPYGTLLALSVLEMQCELVEGAGNTLDWIHCLVSLW